MGEGRPSPASKKTVKEIAGLAGAVTQRIDQGHGPSLNWQQVLEAVEHPTTGLNRTELVEVLAYLAAQLVGARQSINADAALAMTSIELTVARFQERRKGSQIEVGS